MQKVDLRVKDRSYELALVSDETLGERLRVTFNTASRRAPVLVQHPLSLPAVDIVKIILLEYRWGPDINRVGWDGKGA